LETVTIAGMLLLLVSCARYFGFALTALMFTHTITEFVVNLQVSPFVVLGLIYLLLFGLGCLIDGVSMLLITAPMILPIVTGLGFDPIWYGIVYVLTVEVAVLTPPVGINLYVLMGIAPDYSLTEIVRGSIPFILIEVLAIVLVTAFPQIALWLPSLMK
jgi:TRAP-type C4-dicarboxylate transport system permease large subunit